MGETGRGDAVTSVGDGSVADPTRGDGLAYGASAEPEESLTVAAAAIVAARWNGGSNGRGWTPAQHQRLTDTPAWNGHSPYPPQGGNGGYPQPSPSAGPPASTPQPPAARGSASVAPPRGAWDPAAAWEPVPVREAAPTSPAGWVPPTSPAPAWAPEEPTPVMPPPPIPQQAPAASFASPPSAVPMPPDVEPHTPATPLRAVGGSFLSAENVPPAPGLFDSVFSERDPVPPSPAGVPLPPPPVPPAPEASATAPPIDPLSTFRTGDSFPSIQPYSPGAPFPAMESYAPPPTAFAASPAFPPVGPDPGAVPSAFPTAGPPVEPESSGMGRVLPFGPRPSVSPAPHHDLAPVPHQDLHQDLSPAQPAEPHRDASLGSSLDTRRQPAPDSRRDPAFPSRGGAPDDLYPEQALDLHRDPAFPSRGGAPDDLYPEQALDSRRDPAFPSRGGAPDDLYPEQALDSRRDPAFPSRGEAPHDLYPEQAPEARRDPALGTRQPALEPWSELPQDGRRVPASGSRQDAVLESRTEVAPPSARPRRELSPDRSASFRPGEAFGLVEPRPLDEDFSYPEPGPEAYPGPGTKPYPEPRPEAYSESGPEIYALPGYEDRRVAGYDGHAAVEEATGPAVPSRDRQPEPGRGPVGRDAESGPAARTPAPPPEAPHRATVQIGTSAPLGAPAEPDESTRDELPIAAWSATATPGLVGLRGDETDPAWITRLARPASPEADWIARPGRGAPPDPDWIARIPEPVHPPQAEDTDPAASGEEYPDGRGPRYPEPAEPTVSSWGHHPAPAGETDDPVRTGRPRPASEVASSQDPLPRREPREPDVPEVPGGSLADLSAAASLFGELSRIAKYLRHDEVGEEFQRTEGFDVNDILNAVRQVPGVSDAKLRWNPGGVHTLRLDLIDGTDGADVSRRVARLLKEKMGLAAEPNEPRPEHRPVPPPPEPPRPFTDEPQTGRPRLHRPYVTGSQTGDRVVPRGAGSGPVSTRPAAVTPGGTAGQAQQASGMPLPRATSGEPAPRVVLDHVQVKTLGLDANVEVRLVVPSGGYAVGNARGPAVDAYLLRLAAVAAASAIDRLMLDPTSGQARGRVFIEHVSVVPLGSCEVAVVVLLLVYSGGWVEQLSGSALVNGEPRQAVVCATLSALNRRLEALL